MLSFWCYNRGWWGGGLLNRCVCLFSLMRSCQCGHVMTHVNKHLPTHRGGGVYVPVACYLIDPFQRPRLISVFRHARFVARTLFTFTHPSHFWYRLTWKSSLTHICSPHNQPGGIINMLSTMLSMRVCHLTLTYSLRGGRAVLPRWLCFGVMLFDWTDPTIHSLV